MNKIVLIISAGIALVLIVALILYLKPSENPDKIIDTCISACKDTNIDLSKGPCLLNPIPNTDWVCDVAHNPRQAIDNLPENQCSAYRSGKAHHFVEVDTQCKLIRAY